MKFDKERTDKIIKLIQAGNYNETAALASGISKPTFYKWMKEGEEGKDQEKIDFFNSIKRAKAEAEVRNVLLIQKASETTWQAAAWWLERTDYKKWGRKERHELSGEGLDIRISYED